jgi:hypothetical protein
MGEDQGGPGRWGKVFAGRGDFNLHCHPYPPPDHPVVPKSRRSPKGTLFTAVGNPRRLHVVGYIVRQSSPRLSLHMSQCWFMFEIAFISMIISQWLHMSENVHIDGQWNGWIC